MKCHYTAAYDSTERLIVDQEVPGSRPGGGTITFSSLALSSLRMPNFKPDIEPDRCARHTVECRYRFVDLRISIRDAPAGLCVAAKMVSFACRCKASCLLRPLRSAETAQRAIFYSVLPNNHCPNKDRSSLLSHLLRQNDARLSHSSRRPR